VFFRSSTAYASWCGRANDDAERKSTPMRRYALLRDKSSPLEWTGKRRRAPTWRATKRFHVHRRGFFAAVLHSEGYLNQAPFGGAVGGRLLAEARLVGKERTARARAAVVYRMHPPPTFRPRRQDRLPLGLSRVIAFHFPITASLPREERSTVTPSARAEMKNSGQGKAPVARLHGTAYRRRLGATAAPCLRRKTSDGG